MLPANGNQQSVQAIKLMEPEPELLPESQSTEWVKRLVSY